ncbi:PHP domain-containing protein [Salinibacterium sp. SYSU T00001]|uniref:PHP domain-containing protein n=1 Tax=Homoserinimonas sedimenticola TaxID=2986805 RepID=UPI0022364321|nr:PHP domain-containing protein [Salinibacterium sedimenticola]MCW4386513.1 PHP domain-containing protein [Salinibacterium sedimenticola]
MTRVIDLHTHSSVSDGTDTPSLLVAAALEARIDVIALTDHDSTAGWEEARTAAAGSSLTVIPGMEFSTRLGWQSVHVLAYLFDPTDAELIAETARIRSSRLTRAEGIVHRLAVDYSLTWDDVLAHTQEGATVGRPHIADALVARGHATTRSEAFEAILHPRHGYTIPHYAPDPEEAIRLVRAAGGVPVLAHPATAGREAVFDDATLKRLVDAGLFGLEVGHRENTEKGKRMLRSFAERHDLVMTGSSDYHGLGKPNRLGENTTDEAALERIVAEGRGSDPFAP